MNFVLSLPSLQIYVLQEDLSNRTMQQVTSCEVTAVEEVRVDRLVPLYCTIVSPAAMNYS